MVSVEASFYDDLLSVEKRLGKKIAFKSTQFDELIDLPLDELDRHACPALSLAAGRIMGTPDEKAVTLASIIQLIFLADQVHSLVKDGHETESQYPVLVGDYLYGLFFLELTKQHLDHMLKPMAEVIAAMSEGTITRWIAKSKHLNFMDMAFDEQVDIFSRERASLTGLAARLGAQLAKAPVFLQEAMELFGRRIGLAWAAYKEKSESLLINKFLEESRQVLDDLRHYDNLELKPLYELHHYFTGQLLKA